MEDKLDSILDEIEKSYSLNLVDNEKAFIVAEKWKEYYLLSYKYNVTLFRAFDLYTMGENCCFLTSSKNKVQPVLESDVSKALETLKDVLNSRKMGNNIGVTPDVCKIILDYVIYNSRKQLLSLGIDVENNSLNGLCELAQISTLCLLENLGLKVSKNSVENSFGCNFHHVFGTVTFPVYQNEQVEDVTFLVDASYRQFFNASRCNEGRYYNIDDLLGSCVAPDPGYFMNTDEKMAFSDSLIENGYVIFNDNNAKIYGDAFRYSATAIGDLVNKVNEIDNTSGYSYKKIIMNSTEDYALSVADLIDYGFLTEFPDKFSDNNKYY